MGTHKDMNEYNICTNKQTNNIINAGQYKNRVQAIQPQKITQGITLSHLVQKGQWDSYI